MTSLNAADVITRKLSHAAQSLGNRGSHGLRRLAHSSVIPGSLPTHASMWPTRCSRGGAMRTVVLGERARNPPLFRTAGRSAEHHVVTDLLPQVARELLTIAPLEPGSSRFRAAPRQRVKCAGARRPALWSRRVAMVRSTQRGLGEACIRTRVWTMGHGSAPHTNEAAYTQLRSTTRRSSVSWNRCHDSCSSWSLRRTRPCRPSHVFLRRSDVAGRLAASEWRFRIGVRCAWRTWLRYSNASVWRISPRALRAAGRFCSPGPA